MCIYPHRSNIFYLQIYILFLFSGIVTAAQGEIFVSVSPTTRILRCTVLREGSITHTTCC